MTGPDLQDQIARDRIATTLGETLFVSAGAGSGKTRSLVDRVLALVDADVELRSIATITFTEKAAGELRDRIRTRCEAAAADPGHQPASRERFRGALEQVDIAAISTLHAFAQRILTEHAIEAALPPNVAVLDEVASQIEFEDRWVRFRDQMLDDPALERTLLLAFATGIALKDLRHLASVFGANWDLVTEPQRIPWDREEPPPPDIDGFIDELEALLARRDECADVNDTLCVYLTDELEPVLQRLRAADGDELEALRILQADKPTFKAGNKGTKKGWGDEKPAIVAAVAELGEQRQVIVQTVAEACVHRLAVELATFTGEAARERRDNGRLEFHDLLVLSRELLRGPNGLLARGRLRRRYQRLLLDEFQDTDPIQIDLAVLIASDDEHAADKPWWDIPVEPGRLFFVGDPKQSIYRFRRADIDLYLQAMRVFGIPALALTTNFRTSPAVIAWINHVFGELIRHEEGSQPDYQALTPSPTRTNPPAGPAVVLLGAGAHVGKVSADELREQEAADVADTVLAAQGWQVSERQPDQTDVWRPATLGDITILLPARTSLAALERALEQRGIPYRAETSSLVYSSPEVRDLLAVARAIADPTDQLSLVTALRSAVFGCGDDDLFTYKMRHGGRWSITAPGAQDVPDDHPVVVALRYLGGLHREVAWLSPSQLLDRVVRERRLLELGYAEGRPRDLWRRLRFVVDQARSWSESESGTLREYLAWARLQSSDTARVAETILPETDDDSVRIMTIHGSKGLEFPITIVSGMSTAMRGVNVRVNVAFPPDKPVGIKVGSNVRTAEFERFAPVDEQMDFHERLRLLYVACTRAKDHLVVSLHRKDRKAPDDDRNATSAELLARAGTDAPHAVPLDTSALTGLVLPPPAAPEPLIGLGEWQAERVQRLATSTVRRSLGASDVVLDGAGLQLGIDALDSTDAEDDEQAEVAAGTQKQARDLDLPPWQKGRYGTAIGRAVHAVLQMIDLSTGAGIDDAARAQAAAEGVIGREDDIRRLAAAALGAPSVQEAVTRSRWRETYVATAIGERTLEGYIDLLYRAADGLVVVDYKTASAGADLDQRMRDYRAQGGAYAVAVEGATGERVSRVVFVFLTSAGVEERELDDLEGAKAAVISALGEGIVTA